MTTPNLSPKHRDRLAALADVLDTVPAETFFTRHWFNIHTLIGVAIATDEDLHRWYWLFSDGWRETDNTPSGAAARIRHLLSHGLPEDWREQMSGDAKLCYETTTQET